MGDRNKSRGSKRMSCMRNKADIGGVVTGGGGFLVPKADGVAVPLGALLYWSPSKKEATIDLTAGPYLGRAVEATAADSPVVYVAVPEQEWEYRSLLQSKQAGE